MFRKATHLSQEELVRFVDGEPPAIVAYRARRHLAACLSCRSREQHLEVLIDELLHLHRLNLNNRIFDGAGLRARLKSELAVAARLTHRPWRSHFAMTPAVQTGAYICLALLFGTLTMPSGKPAGLAGASAPMQMGSLPNSKLTPGAARPIKLAEICPASNDDLDPEVSPSVQTAVFREYGITNASASDYQVDYLINPQLGGTDDIHNLWPQPYKSALWNAHEKDALEDRLQGMVCGGQIDLASAQKDLAGDWISAYKKYFHTAKPDEALAVVLLDQPKN
jgi:hypothetical protein